MLERFVPSKIRYLYYLMEVHIYIGVYLIKNPSECPDVGGQTAREAVRGGALGETLSTYMCHHEGHLMGRAKPHAEGGLRPKNPII
jgi:hypothetical protein